MRWVGVVAAALLLLGSVWVVQELYRPYRAYPERTVVRIEPGSRAVEVADLLVSDGVLSHRLPFLIRYFLGRSRHSIKAGEYLFDRPLRPIDVYWKVVEGDLYLRTVVIPEGADRFDIARIYQEQLGINPGALLHATERVSLILDLDPQAKTLEGYLFPDTYRFSYNADAATVVSTMLTRFRHVLEAEFHSELHHTPRRLREVITLASLVEKETPDPAERPVVAGVFLERLKKRWPLQCDPTVVYALRLGGRFIDTVTRDDLAVKSAYNTYRVLGLPPGPICNPGKASLHAALYPAAVKFLYFVSNNQGGHLFAKTLAEHQRNVARYRKQAGPLSRMSPEVKRHAP